MSDQPLPPPPASQSGTTSVLAVVSFVSGLLAWFSLPLFFLVVPTPLATLAAIICGHMARAEIRRNPGKEGDGFAIAGLVMGWAMVVSCVLAIVLIFGSIAALLAWIAAVQN